MVFKMSDTLVLSSSVDAMTELPQQAFALTLSDDMIEDMIACVQKGHDIQLSLGDSPTFLFANEEHKIEATNFLPYDLYYSDETNPTSLQKLPTEAMPLLGNKPRVVERRAAPLPKRNPVNIRPPRTKTTGKAPASDLAADIATLQQGLAQAAADTQTTRIAEGPAVKKRGGTYDLMAKPLPSASSGGLKSNTASPALSSAFGSPLSQAEQEEGRKQANDTAKRQRFPLIHELAVRDRSFDELLEKWDGVEEDLTIHLRKISVFQSDTQLWSLSKNGWRDLDVFNYAYRTDDDRQKAIDNAIRQYDRMRCGTSDPVWQKLLPKEDRGKGICLSRLQASIANKAAAAVPTSTSSSTTTQPPKINIQKPDASSPSTTSEKSDSTSNSTNMAKGGEPMARSNSGNKPKKISASEAQAKRLMGKPGAPKTVASKAAKTTTSAKPSPKVGPTTSPKISPVKSASKVSTAKGGRVLSKEFISDSDSDGSGDEAPVTSTAPKAKLAQKERPVEKAKPAEKPKPANRARDSPAPVPKAVAKQKPTPVRRGSPAVERTTTTGASAKAKQPVKRSREEEDDSSSEGAPLMKRQKSREQMANKAPVTQFREQEHRKSSDNAPGSSQMSRTSSSGTSASTTKAPPSRQMARPPKATKTPVGTTAAKTTSPVKSSPLSSPPNNASDTDERRRPVVASKKRKQDTTAESSEDQRRERNDSSDSSGAKRRKLSPDTLSKANEFKAYYATYEALHKEIMSLEYPPADKLDKLTSMHKRLASLKEEIYNEVE